MTLKPIQGAPIGAPIPDFPTGEPAPLVVPESQSTRPPVEPLPASLPPSASTLSLPPARRPGPVEIRGSGDSTLTFRCSPEIPAIKRSSMTISITGESTADASPQKTHLDLATDEAKAFLLALRDGNSLIVIADSRTAFQLEFVITEDGPTFTVSRPGQAHTARRFDAGRSYDVKAMAANLLADLGPPSSSLAGLRSCSTGAPQLCVRRPCARGMPACAPSQLPDRFGRDGQRSRAHSVEPYAMASPDAHRTGRRVVPGQPSGRPARVRKQTSAAVATARIAGRSARPPEAAGTDRDERV